MVDDGPTTDGRTTDGPCEPNGPDSVKISKLSFYNVLIDFAVVVLINGDYNLNFDHENPAKPQKINLTVIFVCSQDKINGNSF